MIIGGKSYGDTLTLAEVAGIKASPVPITAENPVASAATCFTLNGETLESTKTIKIGDANDSITISKTDISYVRTTPKWKNLFLPMKPNSVGWITKDSGNTYYFHINTSNSALANQYNSYFTMLPDDYVANSQIKIYAKWGFPPTDVIAGKSTTWTLSYNTLASGTVLGALTVLPSVAVNSPHTANQEIVTLLGSPTLTANAGDMLNMVAHFAVSDATWNRYIYGLLIQYQSNQ